MPRGLRRNTRRKEVVRIYNVLIKVLHTQLVELVVVVWGEQNLDICLLVVHEL